jgi:hypothetical protein
MVLGSVIMVFEEVCPERLDLLHKHYRKLCNLLVRRVYHHSRYRLILMNMGRRLF